MGEQGDVKSVVSIPTKLEDITSTWLSTILSSRISPDNFLVFGNVHEGTGFLSQMFRLRCEEISHGDQVKKELNLIVKLLPEPDSSPVGELARSICVGQGFDETEIKFYQQVYPDLVEQLEELKNYICPFYLGHINEDPRTSIIIMEDMKPLGYKTISFNNELNRNQLEESVKFMAKFHYAANVLQLKKKEPLNKLYTFLQVEENDEEFDKSLFASMCIEGLGKLDGFFEGQNCSEELREYYRSSSLTDQVKMARAVFGARRNEYRTLVHGDLWSNNILVHDDPSMPLKMIDWQLASYADPAYDLAVLVVSCIPRNELNRQSIDRLLALYFSTFSEYANKNGLQILITRDLEQFSQFFYTFGMSYVYYWFTYSCYPFAGNFPRLIQIYEFLKNNVRVMEFLATLT